MNNTKNIYALSYTKFRDLIHDYEITDENVKEHNTAFIQILNMDYDDGINFTLKQNDTNVLALRFDDADESVEEHLVLHENYKQVYPMNEDDAKRIIEFVERNEHRGTFIVHCMAGQSRSGGVTRYLAEHFDIPFSEYSLNNPFVRPNYRIVGMLRAAAEK